MKLEGRIGDHGPIATVTVVGTRGQKAINVLLDSAARLSVVGTDVAQAIGATIVGKKAAKGVCGACELEVAEVEVRVGAIAFPKAKVLCKADLEPYGGLLGQDFLHLGTLYCDGPRRTYSFMLP